MKTNFFLVCAHVLSICWRNKEKPAPKYCRLKAQVATLWLQYQNGEYDWKAVTYVGLPAHYIFIYNSAF